MEVILDKHACKALDKMDDKNYNRVKDAFNGLLEEPPRGDIKSLQGIIGAYRLRVGKYRIIYEKINDNIYVHKISPRGDAYK